MSTDVQPDPNLIFQLGPMKNDVLLFSGNLGRFSPFERGTTSWWPFVAVQPPAPGDANLPLFNVVFAGATVKPLWPAGTAQAHPINSCAARAPLFATARTAPVAQLVGPALLGRRRWCIDIHWK